MYNGDTFFLNSVKELLSDISKVSKSQKIKSLLSDFEDKNYRFLNPVSIFNKIRGLFK